LPDSRATVPAKLGQTVEDGSGWLGEQLLAPGAAQQVSDRRERQRQHLGDREDVGGDFAD